ncbi:hypothetical protein BHE74_00010345 [Ensete ventricosum]|nr:hypothetical protein BHE74_00010345 [Ensete ventricosum]
MCPVPVPTICRYTSTDRFAISICIARYRRYIRSIRLSVRGSLVTRRYRQKSIVGGQFRPSAVDFDRQRPIEGEIDYRRSIEGEKGKKRKRRKKKKRRRTYFPRDVIEFVQFKERLENSNQLLMARLDVSILQLKQKADSLQEVEVNKFCYL